jgi:hypothetical protein
MEMVTHPVNGRQRGDHMWWLGSRALTRHFAMKAAIIAAPVEQLINCSF